MRFDVTESELWRVAGRGAAVIGPSLTGPLIGYMPRFSARICRDDQVSFDRARLIGRSGDLRFDISAGEWAAQLEAVDAGAFVEVLVPLGGGEEHTIAVRRLATARQLLREGKVEEALGESRKALEVVREAYGTGATVRAAEKKPDRDARRTGRPRWLLPASSPIPRLLNATRCHLRALSTWTIGDQYDPQQRAHLGMRVRRCLGVR